MGKQHLDLTLPSTLVQKPFDSVAPEACLRVMPPVHSATSPIMRALATVKTSLSPGFIKDADDLGLVVSPYMGSIADSREQPQIGKVAPQRLLWRRKQIMISKMIRSDAAAPPGLSGPTGAAMEGGGSYNRNSAQQGAGGISALPLLEKAAASVAIAPDDDPIVIADFGSSQGRNSFLPLSTAIKSLRRRLGVDRPISVFHTDQPGNDFSTLFQVVHTDPDSYLRDQPNVFTFATGKSFYEPLFPPNTITLGWSSYALMWPSQLAALIPGHVFSTRSSGAVLAAFNKRGDDDWRRFLSLRATELRTGGRLVIVIAARGDEGLNGTRAADGSRKRRAVRLG